MSSGSRYTTSPTTGPKKTDLPLPVPRDVSAALHALGIDHDIRGDEAYAPCPSPDHDDRHPSWSCNLESGLHSCFSCGFKGSFVRLAAVVRGTRYDAATAWVQSRHARAGVASEEIARAVLPARAVSEADLWEATDPPPGQLSARRISLEAAQALEIRWNSRRDCWVFPIRDPRSDKLLGWQEKEGRVFMNRPRDVEKSRAVFGFRHLRQTGTAGPVVVVESPVDAARFWTAGIRRAVSTFGSGFSDYQVHLVRRQSDEVIFALDNDEAGHKKTARWIAENVGMRRSHTRVFDYGGCFDDDTGRHVHPKGDGRDPGDLTDHQLQKGVEWATPARNTYFEGVSWWR